MHIPSLMLLALLASGETLHLASALHRGPRTSVRATPRQPACQMAEGSLDGASTLSATEAALLESIRVSSEQKKPVLKACSNLGSQAPESLSSLQGDWRVEWTDLGKGAVQKLLFKLISPSLKMLSFGALPPIKVNLTASYNRVTPSGYDLLQCFELPAPGSDGTVDVAMALRGSGTVSSEQANRLDVRFETVVLLPAAAGDADEFLAALDAAGLAEAAAAGPIQIAPKPTYIDVEHLTEALRVHKGASGATYVLQRVEEIPYALSSS